MKLLILLLQFTPFILCAQSTILSLGGEASGAGGSASFSMGQLFDNSNSNSSYFIQEGVQQTYNLNTDGLLELNSKNFNVFPIPTIDFMNIELKTDESDFEYFIVSLNGNIVDKGRINKQLSSINISHINTGEYQLLCKSEKSFFTKKIIKL